MELLVNEEKVKGANQAHDRVRDDGGGAVVDVRAHDLFVARDPDKRHERERDAE